MNLKGFAAECTWLANRKACIGFIVIILEGILDAIPITFWHFLSYLSSVHQWSTNFKRIVSHIKILGVGKVTQNKFDTEGPNYMDATVKRKK